MNKHLILLALLAVAVAGCKKDDEEPDTHDHGTTGATFRLDYGFHWGADDFALGTAYTDGNAHAIKFTSVRFYAGQPELFNAGTEVAHYHDLYLLFDASEPEGEKSIGSMSAATVDQLKFFLGVDSVSNHADPTLADAPLNDATMHWTWNPAAGYKFFVLEGRVDDDGNGVDDTDPEFVYHCATDDALREAELAFSGSVADGGTLAPHLEIMMDQVVSGVDFLATPVGMGYDAVNAQLMDNLVNALEIE